MRSYDSRTWTGRGGYRSPHELAAEKKRRRWLVWVLGVIIVAAIAAVPCYLRAQGSVDPRWLRSIGMAVVLPMTWIIQLSPFRPGATGHEGEAWRRAKSLSYDALMMAAAAVAIASVVDVDIWSSVPRDPVDWIPPALAAFAAAALLPTFIAEWMTPIRSDTDVPVR